MRFFKQEHSQNGYDLCQRSFSECVCFHGSDSVFSHLCLPLSMGNSYKKESASRQKCLLRAETTLKGFRVKGKQTGGKKCFLLLTSGIHFLY